MARGKEAEKRGKDNNRHGKVIAKRVTNAIKPIDPKNPSGQKDPKK